MSCPFSEEQLAQLQAFIELCKFQPQILHHPKLAFFKDYLVSLGVTLPTATFGTKHFTPSGDGANNAADNDSESSSDDDIDAEKDIDLNMEGVIDSDPVDKSQYMGDATKEPSDEERDQSDEKRTEAMKAFSEQQFEKALNLYTEAIKLNPQSALLFAKRGQVYLKLNKPNACIQDCNRALELNCDSAAAYKFRGRAHRLLGKFEEACHDLCESLKIDYDDQTNEWLNEVKPNAEKLRQHKLSLQRKKEEKEHSEKLRKLRKAQEARTNAAKAQTEANAGGMPGAEGFPAGFPAGGFSSPDLANLLMDPEIISTFQDPEVMAAFTDLSTNPANFIKYQNNPKISAAIKKLQAKLGKGGSMPFGDKFPGAGGAGGPGTGPKLSDDDVGLD